MFSKILDTIFSDTIERKKAVVAAMLAIADSDGSLDKHEMNFIVQKADQYGIRKGEVLDLYQSPSSELSDFNYNQEEAILVLTDLIYVILIDGEVHTNELKIGTELARHLGFNKKEFTAYLETEIKRLKHASEELEKLDNPTKEDVYRTMYISTHRFSVYEELD